VNRLTRKFDQKEMIDSFVIYVVEYGNQYFELHSKYVAEDICFEAQCEGYVTHLTRVES